MPPTPESCRSAVSARPASPRQPRTGCTSSRSTSSPTTPRQLRDLLTRWTVAAERMTLGAEAAPGGVVGGGPWNVPQDTGEALDLAPGHLTVTIGYGPTLFDDRFGLADRRPEALRELPAFLGDDLDPARSGGDIVIQACSDDPQVAVHAVRNLVRMGFGVVAVRWSQLGFGRTSSTSQAQVTPRNMFGFKDGTANIKSEDTAGARPARVGRADGRARRGGVDGRRLLPRGAADPDAHRDLGPHPAHGAGADHRARQEGRCAAGRLGRVRRARLRGARHRRPAADPG